MGLYRKQPARAAPTRGWTGTKPYCMRRSGDAWQLRESSRREALMAGFGFAFVAHGYLEPSRRVPGERERYLRSRRKTLIVFFF